MIVTKQLRVNGMQCGGCETIIENAIRRLDGIHSVKADYLKSAVDVGFDNDKINITIIQTAIVEKGYTTELFSFYPHQNVAKIIYSTLALMGLVFAIILARKFGHGLSLPEINSHTTYGMIFIVGLLTGLHCIGMCGSYIIGYSAKDAVQSESVIRSHIYYGVGKTLSYAFIGAFFGFVGSMFRITIFISGLSIIIAGTLLIIYGLSMLKIFEILKRIRVKLPNFIVRFTSEKGKQLNKPFLIGVFSGLILGCGPLQMMYLMAAGNGNALEGAIILGIFGLGTLPALLGFGIIARLLSNTMTRRFIHATGIILIVLGSIMLSNGIERTKPNSGINTAHSCCQGKK